VGVNTVTPPRYGKFGARFEGAACKGIGGTMIVVAVFSWIAASTAWWCDAGYANVSTGYWCGSIYFFAGIVAAHAGRHKNDTAIVCCLALSIFSLIFSSIQLGFSVSGIILDLQNGDAPWLAWRITCNVVLTIAACVQWLISLPLLIICSRAVCCHPTVEPHNSNLVVTESQTRVTSDTHQIPAQTYSTGSLSSGYVYRR